MEQKNDETPETRNEETSRAESSHKGGQNLNWKEVTIAKMEDYQDESSWFPPPTAASFLTTGLETFEVPQDCVGENDFTGDVGRNGGRRRKRSEVWKDFTEEKKPDGSGGARCNHCNLLLSASCNSGTSHLNRHIKLYCPRKRYKDVRQMILSSSSKGHEGGSKEFRFDQDVSERNLAKLVVCAELPLNIVEQPAFINFVQSLQPIFKFGSQETVRHDCLLLYEEEKNKIQYMLRNLNSRVSFTLDTWTSDQNVAFMSLSAHFIDDDFVLRRKMLNFKRISSFQTSDEINDEIAKCIVGWELDEKVFAVAVDGSTTDDVLVTRFKETWREKLLADGNYLHIRCCASVLTIMIEDGLKVLCLPTERIRNIIRHVTAAPSHMEAFNECARHCGLAAAKGLNLDVSAKWNATYGMLQRALSYKDAFVRYTQLYCHETDAPRHDDWEKTEIILKFLKTFVHALDVFSGSGYPTANLYFEEVCNIRYLLQDEIANCDEMVRNFTSEMEKKLQNYWSGCNMILAIASVFDPRFKFLLIEYCYENAFGEEKAKQKVDEIRDCLCKLYDDYEELKAVKLTTSVESIGQGSDGPSGCIGTLAPIGEDMLAKKFAIYMSEKGLQRKKKTQLDTYLADNVLPTMEGEDFKVLSWWKSNEELYPVLSRMARDILAIPVSTMASKSAFSSCSRLVNRSSISLESALIEPFICAQDWFHDDYYTNLDGMCKIPVTEFSDVNASSVIDEEIFESCLAK